jgi:FMN phosphatase YigB (HAD superfamily)
MATIRAVLADWGHTLFDTAGSVAFLEQWAADHGRLVDRAALERTYRVALDRSRSAEELAKGRDKFPDIHASCWAALWADLEALLPGVTGDLYHFETSAAGWTPFVDTRSFMETLAARGIPLVIVSDVPFDLRPILAHYGLDRFVAHYVLSGERGTVKSEGRLFHIALAAAGVRPDEAIMVGDNPANDGYAVHQGIRTLLLPLVESGAPRGLDQVLLHLE